MVKVKTFGVFRLDVGVSDLEIEASSVKELMSKLPEAIKAKNPDADVDTKALKGCIIAVNGKQVKASAKLQNGDSVWLVPAVAGG